MQLPQVQMPGPGRLKSHALQVLCPGKFLHIKVLHYNVFADGHVRRIGQQSVTRQASCASYGVLECRSCIADAHDVPPLPLALASHLKQFSQCFTLLRAILHGRLRHNAGPGNDARHCCIVANEAHTSAAGLLRTPTSNLM